MKKIFTLFLIITLLLGGISIIQSCRKYDTEVQKTGDPLITSAKTWHQQQVAQYDQSTAAKNKKSKLLQPLWEEAYLQREPDGSSSVIVPAQQADIKTKNLDLYRAFVFRTTNGEIQDGIILELYASENKLKQDKKQLLANYENGFIKNFDGYIIAYDIQYRYLNGVTFKNGRRQTARVHVQKQRSLQLNAASTTGQAKGRIAQTNATMNEGPQCYGMYLVLTWPDGYQEWTLLYPTYCEGGDGSGTPGGGNTNISGADPADAYARLAFADSIRLQNKFDCFDQVSDQGATYHVKLRADLPVNNAPNMLLDPYLSTGHAFITMTKSNNGVSVTQNFGFYPQNGLKSSLNNRVASQIVNDQNHDYDADITIAVTEAQFDAMIAEALLKSKEKYDLSDYNCTDFALDVFNKGRASNNQIVVPDWGPLIGLNINYGTTPNGLYATLKSMKDNGDPTVTVSSTQSPNSTNCP